MATFLLIVYLLAPNGAPVTTTYDYPTAVKCESAKADAVEAMRVKPNGYKLVSAECKPVSVK